MLHQSRFLSISNLPEASAVAIEWLPDSSKMTDDEFKSEVYAEREALEKVHPTAILANTLKMGYTIPPELQEWHNGVMDPVFAKIGLKKLAILVSQDFFSQIAVEQLIDDSSQASLLTKYFENEQAAINWIKE